MILIVSKYLVPKGFRGFTVYPFVFLRNETDRADRVLLNHEQIHLRQQLELFIVLFYLWYLLEYFVRLVQVRKGSLAYRGISFEKEAYENESNSNYLEERGFWKFLKYI